MSPALNRLRYVSYRFAPNETRVFVWSVNAPEDLRGFVLRGEVGLALAKSFKVDNVEMLATSQGVPLEALAGVFADGLVLFPTLKASLSIEIWNSSYEPAIIRIRPLVRGDELDLMGGEPS